MNVKYNKGNGTEKYILNFKEEETMINTGEFKMFGQLEDQAATGDIEAFVFRNGEVTPVDQVENTTDTVIHTAHKKNYGQMEEVANGNANIENFVFQDGEVKPANQAETSMSPSIRTPPGKNYSQAEEIVDKSFSIGRK